jgi:hypothetical protein
MNWFLSRVCLCLARAAGKLDLAAETKEEAKRWVSGLATLIENLKRPPPPATPSLVDVPPRVAPPLPPPVPSTSRLVPAVTNSDLFAAANRGDARLVMDTSAVTLLQ